MTAIGNIQNTASVSPPPVTQLTANPAAGNGGAGGLSFVDVLDAVNPLQHIPGVSSVYRAVTGSQISPASQIAGDTLYGAITGGTSALISFAASSADVAVKQITGTNIAQHVVSAVNAIGSAVTSAGNAGTMPVTNLVAIAATSPAAISTLPTAIDSASNLPTQVTNAAQSIYHTNAQFQNTNAHYQRVQAFDAINKSLIKMAV